MIEAPTLFDSIGLELPPMVAVPEGVSIQERFQVFHELNPWVYDALITLADDLASRGHSKLGIKMLFEVLRWQYARQTTGGDFKLNNNYTSRYVRMISTNRPDLGALFEQRELKAA